MSESEIRDTHTYDDPQMYDDYREDIAEREALAKIVNAFRGYEHYAIADVTRWQKNYATLSKEHKALLWDQPKKFQDSLAGIKKNAEFFTAMLQEFSQDGAPSHLQIQPPKEGESQRVSPGDVDKVRYVLKNLVRDWGEEGAGERAQSHAPLMEELAKWLPLVDGKPAPAVMVPGAGLGRLCVELAARGYAAQGNEFSYYMLLVSSYILNHSSAANQWSLHPWLHSSCNNLTDADQNRSVLVPDMLPCQQPIKPGNLSMCAGDFVEVYGHPDQKGAWDAVVTCFFIDTAHNIVQYLELLSHALREGGVWINIGPLLFHWADAHTYLDNQPQSIEVSLETIERIAPMYNLRCVRHEMRECHYASNCRSMHQTVYKCAFFTMIKDSSLSRGGADKSPAQHAAP
mmetsp:Transcript_23039/g.38568  ORF Transcript_23039/g.38568 Transcript_23039/m.38568 type:complete len:401 (+) Transcript_23039:124-1326(+)|eukprot:CAMPEP_0198204392 /NCGR_PEP_ID=MMETSP1445-20131203/7798_1 /TAXON_ID=36898 /ORGANISM="Pyramimonas sp., Strain CCMP2087" /LENGTH=400 /DNA_ID=CAMNT_0043876255 /DNA_START=121 /DNA_END=1323 /DNA_ORIENTATION=-